MCHPPTLAASLKIFAAQVRDSACRAAIGGARPRTVRLNAEDLSRSRRRSRLVAEPQAKSFLIFSALCGSF